MNEISCFMSEFRECETPSCSYYENKEINRVLAICKDHDFIDNSFEDFSWKRISKEEYVCASVLND